MGGTSKAAMLQIAELPMRGTKVMHFTPNQQCPTTSFKGGKKGHVCNIMV